jgi:hypothetical protein
MGYEGPGFARGRRIPAQVPATSRPRDSRQPATQVRRWLHQNGQKAGDEGIILKRWNGAAGLSLQIFAPAPPWGGGM